MGTIESTIVVDIAFYVLSIIVLAGAIGVVTTKSVFRAGVMLIGSFFGAAGPVSYTHLTLHTIYTV